MKIDGIIRAAARTVSAHRDLKRATEDGANEKALKKYRDAFEKAIGELETVLEAFAMALAKRKPAPSAPFDWNGALRAVQTLVRTAGKVRRGAKVEDVIEGEVIE